MSFSRAHLPKVVTSLEYWDARVLFYLSRIFTDQLKKGESYKKLKKCIHVSILGFIYFKEDDIINWMRFLGGKTQRLIYNRKYNPHLKSLAPFGFRFQFKIHLPGNFPGQQAQTPPEGGGVVPPVSDFSHTSTNGENPPEGTEKEIPALVLLIATSVGVVLEISTVL